MREVKIYKLEIKRDERGWLVEILKRDQLTTKPFGQFYVTTAHPGVVKGNHYHIHKNEWFCVIKGKGKLALQDIETKERKEIVMGEENMLTIKIPPKVAHGIKNIGQGMMYLLAYVDEVFNPQEPDTFPQEVIS